MTIPDYLIGKYNVPVPRYTSYPPANCFSGNFTPADYKEAVIRSNFDLPQAVSIYIHIPFCRQLCHYCGCNTHITRNETLKTAYLDALVKEIEMVAPLLDCSRKVTQVHWGGGTPNFLSTNQIERIMTILKRNFEFSALPEIAIECHPALLTYDYLESLFELGFNRISLGVQDFSLSVLSAVNREIPQLPVHSLVEYIRNSGKARVNLDFIYGLPYQTVQTFSETISEAIRMAPDRIVTFSYAHVPGIKNAQLLLEKMGLPADKEKISLFENAYQLLTVAGYVAIGLDHYSPPDDELSVALQNHSLHRNFQGYCTRANTGQVYAFGATGISQLDNCYAQNAKSTDNYIRLINAGIFATEKGYLLTNEEKFVRHIITRLMCNGYLSWPEAAEELKITVEELKKAVKFNALSLTPFAEENLLTFNDEEVQVTEAGRFFIRNIATCFDPAWHPEGKTYSKAL